MKTLSVAAHTLGCKVNQCDTDNVLQKLSAIGCNIVKFSEIADIYIINTCTVTHTSDKKSRQMIRRAKRQNPGALVAVCGCMTKNSPGGAIEADFIFDAREPEPFVKKIEEQLNITTGLVVPKKTKTRAFIKIQDGCNRFCSYCIVPYVRGDIRSRSLEDILAEARAHISNGAKEIVLTGIQVAAYGEDSGSITLPALIKEVSQLENLTRLRLSSIEPAAVTQEFLDAIAFSDKLCKHFHLSLQSGCEETLKRMNRRYTPTEYENYVSQIKKVAPDASFTTDIIVGFPGETDEEFLENIASVKKNKFSGIHVFEYSKREGTPAAAMPNQVPEIVKKERSKKMRDLGNAMALEFYQKQVGKTLPVLFEQASKGYTACYCPVEVKANIKPNILCDVKITTCTQDGLIGEIIT